MNGLAVLDDDMCQHQPRCLDALVPIAYDFAAIPAKAHTVVRMGAVGSERLGCDGLLPFSARSEYTAGHDPALRGRDGPLMPAPAAKGHPIAQAGLQAAAQAGHPIVADISAGAEQGFGWCDLNIIDGRRQSAADAYRNPVLGRPNLDVVTDALAHRVTITDGHRTGIEYSASTCALGTVGWPWSTPSCGCTASRVSGSPGASVMPSPVSANTNATVYAIAERAANLIRA